MQREEEELHLQEQQKGNAYIVFQDRSLQASLKTIPIIEYTHLTDVAPKRAPKDPRYPWPCIVLFHSGMWFLRMQMHACSVVSDSLGPHWL